MITRPLLAGTLEDLSKIKYPVLATPKLDGIRVLKVSGAVVTRKFKELPNKSVRTKLEIILPDGIDGEVMLREGGFNEIQSQIMSFDGEPDFIFSAFDYVKDNLSKSYEDRIKDLKEWYQRSADSKTRNIIRLLVPKLVSNEEELLAYETKCLSEGYEGVMLRSTSGKYKCGRSTEKEAILLKLKRFTDAEAKVVEFTERLHNGNIKEKDEFGLSKRSHKKEGLSLANTLGALRVIDIESGVDFELGTGFDDTLRKEIWENKDKYLGKIVKYKYQAVGVKEKPRFPVFLGFRHPDDM